MSCSNPPQTPPSDTDGSLLVYANKSGTAALGEIGVRLQLSKVLIFDKALSNLDQRTAEHFAQTIHRIKGQVTMAFITHQVPRGLQVDEVVNMGQQGVHMSLVKEET